MLHSCFIDGASRRPCIVNMLGGSIFRRTWQSCTRRRRTQRQIPSRGRPGAGPAAVAERHSRLELHRAAAGPGADAAAGGGRNQRHWGRSGAGKQHQQQHPGQLRGRAVWLSGQCALLCSICTVSLEELRHSDTSSCRFTIRWCILEWLQCASWQHHTSGVSSMLTYCPAIQDHGVHWYGHHARAGHVLLRGLELR